MQLYFRSFAVREVVDVGNPGDSRSYEREGSVLEAKSNLALVLYTRLFILDRRPIARRRLPPCWGKDRLTP